VIRREQAERIDHEPKIIAQYRADSKYLDDQERELLEAWDALLTEHSAREEIAALLDEACRSGFMPAEFVRRADRKLAALPATEPAQPEHILSEEYKAERFRERHGVAQPEEERR
jgi:hypothetical protein